MTKPAAQLDAEIAEALRLKALHASEAAKRASDDALLAPEQTAAANMHRRAARLHTDTTGTEAAWLHKLAANNHQQAAKARASRALAVSEPTRTQKTFAAYKEKLAAANEHTAMAQEYARQALSAAARKRG